MMKEECWHLLVRLKRYHHLDYVFVTRTAQTIHPVGSTTDHKIKVHQMDYPSVHSVVAK